MLKEFLREVESSSLFSVPIFEGKIIIRGRVLSPSESEAASLNSTLLISQIAPSEGKGLGDLRNLSSELMQDDVSEEAIDRAYSFLKKLKPEQLRAISEQQNKIICQVIKSASMDNGATWEDLKIVLSQEQQSAERNLLWVGMLSASDRTEILNKAMHSHREAVERLSIFRTG